MSGIQYSQHQVECQRILSEKYIEELISLLKETKYDQPVFVGRRDHDVYAGFDVIVAEIEKRVQSIKGKLENYEKIKSLVFPDIQNWR